MWDATEYLKFADERARPFADLLAQVSRPHARAVADLGCGTGHLTRTLAERWPEARVVGVDSSAEMLRQASPLTIPGRLEFVEAAIGMSLDEAFPWPADYQCMHVKLFPHGVFHAENVGGQIDEVLDQRVWLGCFPFRFKGGEAAFSRIVAFVEEK